MVSPSSIVSTNVSVTSSDFNGNSHTISPSNRGGSRNHVEKPFFFKRSVLKYEPERSLIPLAERRDVHCRPPDEPQRIPIPNLLIELRVHTAREREGIYL